MSPTHQPQTKKKNWWWDYEWQGHMKWTTWEHEDGDEEGDKMGEMRILDWCVNDKCWIPWNDQGGY